MKLFTSAVLLSLAVVPAIATTYTTTDGPAMVAFTEADEDGEGGEQSDEAPPTTAVSEGGIAPAEMAPVADDSAAEDQWTAKFLAPLTAILGVLGVVAAFVMYGTRLRGKYRVVE